MTKAQTKTSVLEIVTNGQGFGAARRRNLEHQALLLITHGRMNAGKLVQIPAEQVEQLGHDILWVLGEKGAR